MHSAFQWFSSRLQATAINRTKIKPSKAPTRPHNTAHTTADMQTTTHTHKEAIREQSGDKARAVNERASERRVEPHGDLRPATYWVPRGLGTGVESSRGYSAKLLARIEGSLCCVDTVAYDGGRYTVASGSKCAIWSATMMRENMELEELRVEELMKWLRCRPRQRISAERLDLVGFCDRIYTEDGGVVHEYPVQRVMFDGQRFLASDKATGGPKTFWPVVLYTLDLRSACVEDGTAVVDIMKRTAVDLGCGVRIQTTEEERAEAVDRCTESMLRDPGKWLLVSLPGGKEKSSGVKPLYSERGTLFCREDVGECVRAAVLNAVHEKAGEQAAREVFGEGPIVVRHLAHVQGWLEKHASMFHLMREESPLVWEIDEWLRSIAGRDEVFLIRVVGHEDDDGRVDHCVAINAKSELVFDSSEEQPMRMEDGVIQCCLGDGVRLERIEEVRRLVVQRKRAGKKKTKRNPRERERKKEAKKRKRMEAQERDADKRRKIKKVAESESEETD